MKSTDSDVLIKWIDNASYSELLQRWRHAPVGDKFFVGEVGDHYQKVMSKKRDSTSDAERVSISKNIGW